MSVIEKIKQNGTLSRIKNHNLVYRTPIDDPTRGIPLGNGSTGLLVWPEKDRLVFTVNHTDLWDLADGDEIRNWNPEDEEYTNALHQAGRLEFRFFAPVLDVLYQKDYNAVLSLADAALNLKSETPFSGLSFKAYASREYNTSVIEVNAEFKEENALEIALENWGSRTFGHWYAQVRRNPELGIGEPETAAADNGIYITRSMRKGAFCIGIRAEGLEEAKASRINSHSGVIRDENKKRFSFRVYISVVPAKTQEEALSAVKGNIERAAAAGQKVYTSHQRDWADFWGRSYIALDDNYLENLWYLNCYFGKCEMLGNYPPHFCNGIWGFNHDYVPWNHFFHWNMQLQYWAHYAAGHSELVKTYLNFRYKQLPNAISTAKRFRNAEGALYTDVTGANAVCDRNTVDNLTPGAQIAHNFWQLYLYDGDLEYLCEKGLPVIYNAALFYLNLVKKGEDGYYHLYRSQAYESSPLMDDVITDHSAMRMIFADALACMNLLDEKGLLPESEDMRDRISEVLPKLYPIQTVPLEEDEYYSENGKLFLSNGIGAGREISCAEAPVAGIFCGEERNPDEAELEDCEYWSRVKKGDVIRNSFSSRKLQHYYGFPDPELSAVFPNDCVGLADKGGRLFAGMTNLMQMKSSFEFDGGKQIVLKTQENVPFMGWSLDPIMLARLGLAKDLKQRFSDTIDAWQWYPCGMGHYGGYYEMVRESNMRFYTYSIKDCDKSDTRFTSPAWEFRHFDLEMLPVTAMAVNEMLLQSYEGAVRLFPACPEDFTGGFYLRAENGIAVTAQMTGGKTDYALYTASADTVLSVFAEKGQYDFYSGSGEKTAAADYDGERSVYRMPIKKGEDILMTPFGITPGQITVREIGLSENTDYKRHNRATLGIEKMY